MTSDRGVILINILVVLAIGSTLVVLMFTSQQNLVDRARVAAASSQAQALAQGAEISARLALQRDMVVAPEADHYAESWAQAAQDQVQLQTGSFSVEIIDLQARFNLALLAQPNLIQDQVILRLVRGVGLTDQTAQKISRAMKVQPVPQSLDDIATLTNRERALLAPHVTVLADRGFSGEGVNLNTADVVVMTAVLGNAAAVRQLVKRREDTGFLDTNDLRDVGILATNGAGFTSNNYQVAISAEVDGVTAEWRSTLVRTQGLGVQSVDVVARQLGIQ